MLHQEEIVVNLNLPLRGAEDRYLSRYAVGLQYPAEPSSEKEMQAILLVHREIERRHGEWTEAERQGEKKERTRIGHAGKAQIQR